MYTYVPTVFTNGSTHTLELCTFDVGDKGWLKNMVSIGCPSFGYTYF